MEFARIRFVGYALFLLMSASAHAGSPRVTFDVPSVVACRDVTTPEFSQINPGERLIEAKLAVSSLVIDGKPDDLVEYMLRLESPEGTALVVDYAPKSLLASDYAGTLSVEQKQERTNSLGAGIGVGLDHYLKLNGTGESGRKESTTLKYELLPPLAQLSASGTFERGHGVYFKLKPSRRTSLEGTTEIQVVLRVSDSWRSDYVYLHCQATGTRKGVVRQLDEPARWGSRGFIIPLYLAGDSPAKQAADEFKEAEAKLREAAVAFVSASKSRSKASLDPLSSIFAGSEPKPATDWLDHLVFGSVQGSSDRLDLSVPAKMRPVAAEFLAAKRKLGQMSNDQ